MATTIKIGIDSSSATKGLDNLARKVDALANVSQAAGNDASQAFNQMAMNVDEVEQEARQAAAAVGQLEANAHAAAAATRQVGSSSKFAGEATQGAADAAFDFAKSLGGGGIAGAAQAVLPKVSGLIAKLAGPWGAAAAFAAGTLATLTAGMFNNAEAAEEQARSIDESKRAMEEFIASVKDRIAAERSVHEGSLQTNESALKKAHTDREDTLRTLDELREQQAKLQEVKLALDDAQRKSATGFLPDRFRSGSGNQKEIEGQLETLQEQIDAEQKRLFETETHRENILVKLAQQRREAAKLFDEQAQRKRVADELEAADQDRKQAGEQFKNLKTQLTLELDPSAREKKLIEDELAERKKILERANLDNDEFVREWAKAQESAQKRLKDLQDQQTQKELDILRLQKEQDQWRIDHERQVATEHYQAVQREVEKLRSPDGGAAIDNLAKQTIDSLSPKQIAKQLAKQRTDALEINSKIEDAEYRRKFGTGSQEEVEALQKQRDQQAADIRRQSFRDVARGRIRPEEQQALGQEIAMASQNAAQAMVQQAQQTGAIGNEAATALSSAVQTISEQGRELAQVQQQLRSLQKATNAMTQQSARRRAQMGGGR